jgi:hypothetical protein
LDGEFDEVETEQDEESPATQSLDRTVLEKTSSKRSFDELDSDGVQETSTSEEIPSGMNHPRRFILTVADLLILTLFSRVKKTESAVAILRNYTDSPDDWNYVASGPRSMRVRFLHLPPF